MAVAISVKLDIDRARAFYRGQEAEVNKAAARALQRTAVTVRAEAIKDIRQGLNVKAGALRNDLKIRTPRAGGRRLFIRDVEAANNPIPLKDYGARQTTRGVSFKVGKTAKRTRYEAKGRKGFIRPELGGNVFVRTEDDPPGPRKGRIRKVYGPSVGQYFLTRRVQESARRTAATRWSIEFTRELAFRTGARRLTST